MTDLTTSDIIIILIMDIIWFIASLIYAVIWFKEKNKNEFISSCACIFISPVGFIPLCFLLSIGILFLVLDYIPNFIYKVLSKIFNKRII